MKSRIINILKNKYFIVLLIAGVWMLLFDRYNFLSQRQMDQHIGKLEKNKVFYQEGMETTDERVEELKEGDEIEKLAREKYLMKKKHEDVFVVMEEEEDN